MTIKLPTYEECAKKHDAELEMTPLELFIFDNEPAGPGDTGWRQTLVDLLEETVKEDRVARRQPELIVGSPINMVLHCPTCSLQHIDEPHGDWTNPSHKSHLCARCGTIWRPADVATNGVARIDTKGTADNWVNYGYLSQQDRVVAWLLRCFGPNISYDTTERSYRFFEEACELMQTCRFTSSEAHQMVDHVYDRSVGKLKQEIGGVIVTLLALCEAHGIVLHEAAELEIDRISGLIPQIRAKQAGKVRFTP